MKTPQIWLLALALCASFHLNCGSGSSDVGDNDQAGAGTRPGEGAPGGVTPTFSQINSAIIQPRCTTCHNDTNLSGGVSYATYAGVLSRVTPGNPEGSLLYQRVADSSMPQTGGPLSGDELAQIRAWISAGAKND